MLALTLLAIFHQTFSASIKLYNYISSYPSLSATSEPSLAIFQMRVLLMLLYSRRFNKKYITHPVSTLPSLLVTWHSFFTAQPSFGGHATTFFARFAMRDRVAHRSQCVFDHICHTFDRKTCDFSQVKLDTICKLFSASTPFSTN